MSAVARREAAEERAAEEKRKAEAEHIASKTMRILDLERQLRAAQDHQEATDAQLQDCEDALGKKSSECNQLNTSILRQEAQLVQRDEDIEIRNNDLDDFMLALDREQKANKELRDQCEVLQQEKDAAVLAAAQLQAHSQDTAGLQRSELARAERAEKQLAEKVEEMMALQSEHEGCATRDSLRGEFKEQLDELADEISRLAADRDDNARQVQEFVAGASRLEDEIKSEPEVEAPVAAPPAMVDQAVNARPLPAAPSMVDQVVEARPLPRVPTMVDEATDARPMPPVAAPKDVGLEARPLPPVPASKDVGLEARPLPEGPVTRVVTIREYEQIAALPTLTNDGVSVGCDPRPLPPTMDTGVSNGVGAIAPPAAPQRGWIMNVAVDIKNRVVDSVAGPNLTAPHVLPILSLVALLGGLLFLYLAVCFFTSGAASAIYGTASSCLHAATATTSAYARANDPTRLSNIALRSAGYGHKSGFTSAMRFNEFPTAYKTHFGFEDASMHSPLVAMVAKWRFGDDSLREAKLLWELRGAGGWFWFGWTRARENGFWLRLR